MFHVLWKASFAELYRDVRAALHEAIGQSVRGACVVAVAARGTSAQAAAQAGFATVLTADAPSCDAVAAMANAHAACTHVALVHASVMAIAPTLVRDWAGVFARADTVDFVAPGGVVAVRVLRVTRTQPPLCSQEPWGRRVSVLAGALKPLVERDAQGRLVHRVRDAQVAGDVYAGELEAWKVPALARTLGLDGSASMEAVQWYYMEESGRKARLPRSAFAWPPLDDALSAGARAVGVLVPVVIQAPASTPGAQASL